MLLLGGLLSTPLQGPAPTSLPLCHHFFPLSLSLHTPLSTPPPLPRHASRPLPPVATSADPAAHGTVCGPGSRAPPSAPLMAETKKETRAARRTTTRESSEPKAPPPPPAGPKTKTSTKSTNQGGLPRRRGPVTEHTLVFKRRWVVRACGVGAFGRSLVRSFARALPSPPPPPPPPPPSPPNPQEPPRRDALTRGANSLRPCATLSLSAASHLFLCAPPSSSPKTQPNLSPRARGPLGARRRATTTGKKKKKPGEQRCAAFFFVSAATKKGGEYKNDGGNGGTLGERKR